MENTKHRLIFIFHVLDNLEKLEDNPIYELHFKYLKYYRSVFDEVIFIITADDLNNKLIYDVEYKLSTIFIDIKNVKYIIEQNHKKYREGIHFYNHVLKKLDDYDGLTFFGHTKGVFNYTQNINVSNWVSALYILNLSNIYDVDNYLDNMHDYTIFAGLYTSKYCTQFITTWYPSGSFYWMNCKKISKYIKDNNIDIDYIIYKDYYNSIRYIAEMFFPKLFDESYIAYNDMRVLKHDFKSETYGSIKFDMYKRFDEYLKETLSYNDYKYILQIRNEVETNI